MKQIRKALRLAAGILLLGSVACKKTSIKDPENSENSITDEVAKIETTWDGIFDKNESYRSVEKKEARASSAIRMAALAAVNEQYQEYLRNLGSGVGSQLRLGNFVGVIKNGLNCNGYDELYIYMDCEDNDPRTGWVSSGGSYRPHWDIGNNAGLRFCIVPGNDFHSYQHVDPTTGAVTNFAYAVLRVTTNFYPDAFEINRYHDNEDNNNKNSAWYEPWGQPSYPVKASTNPTTSVYRTYIDNNSLMSFHVFNSNLLPTTPFTQWPDFNGMSYGVFAHSLEMVNTSDPNRNANLYIDDEDHNNVNDFIAEENVSQWYPAGDNFDYFNPLIGMVEAVDQGATTWNVSGFRNTRMFLTKVR
ncbi:MAG TPA: hypothetical protein VD993_11110 [Chitinophagaceae bacterium]|nr:hypothetical protein [Chitinophagaceae bacterium]